MKKRLTAGVTIAALRPDVDGADPMHIDTLCDDIVVKNVAMFRAEQMDRDEWWVCCYLNDAGTERICWCVKAEGRPKRIEWRTTEFPVDEVIYEHEVRGDPQCYGGAK